MLRSEESPFKSKFLAFRHGWYNPFVFIRFSEPYDACQRAEAGFEELGPRGAAAVPELIKILEENRSRESLRLIAMTLGKIGPNAKMAVPALLRAAVSTNTTDHFNEFEALGKIHSAPDIVVPVLIEVMSNSLVDRMDAVAAVEQFQSNAKSAVPALVSLLNDPSITTNERSAHDWVFISDRSRVERALQSIDPKTYAQVVSSNRAVLAR
jgi:hypothetical protein